MDSPVLGLCVCRGAVVDWREAVMLCKDCPHFRITAEPVKNVDFGHAVCDKHDLTTVFLDRRKFKWLSCIEVKEA